MDPFFDDSRGDRNLEDYLFSDYPPNNSNQNSDKDQQFARPIEDEDLFGFYSENNQSAPQDLNTGDSVSQQVPPTLSPEQIKRQKLKEKLLEQARAFSLTPKKLGTGFGKDGTIELVISENVPVANSGTPSIFQRLTKKTKNPACSPENMKGSSDLKWQTHKDQLRKKISAQKRKIWDSFNGPIDNYDEDEEIIDQSDRKDSSLSEVEGDCNDGNEEDAVEDGEDGEDPFAIESEDNSDSSSEKDESMNEDDEESDEELAAEVLEVSDDDDIVVLKNQPAPGQAVDGEEEAGAIRRAKIIIDDSDED